VPSAATTSRPRARRVLAAAARRPALTAAALYALLAIALVSPALLPGHTLSASDYLWSGAPWTAERPADVKPLGSNYEEVDAVTQFQPFLQYARDHGVPLWNPHQMGGRPFVANSQSAIFSPFSWPSLLLPFWWSLGIAAALKLFCAAFGAYVLARGLGIRWAGALMAGVVYGFGLYFVVWLSWPLSSVWAWLPWLLACVQLVVRRPGPRPVAALALVVALQFVGGHPESSFHVLAAGTLFALLALSRIPGGERLRAIGRLAAGLVAGGLLAAVALVPFLELLAHSGDLENRAGRTGGHFPLSSLIAYVLPGYWGRPSQVPTQPFAFAKAYYAGALPLMLALWALVSNRSRERVAIAAAGVVAIAITVGMPGLFDLVTALPGFSHAYNQRLIIVGLLALALLAGAGLGDLLDGVPQPRLLIGGAVALWLIPAVIALARVGPDGIADGLAVAWAFTEPARDTAKDVVPMSAMWTWLVVAGLSVLLLWLRASGRVAGGAFVALALGLVVLDLFRQGVGQNPAIPVSHAEQPVTPAIQRLQAHGPARFVGLAPPVGPQALAPNLAMRYGLYDARGYDFPIERRYNKLWRTQVTSEENGFAPPTLLAATNERALRALGLLGVTDIVQPPSDKPLGLRKTYDGPDARIYANPHALPRAWVVGAERVVPGDDAQLAAISDPAFDPRRTAITPRPLGVSGGGGDTRITRYDPGRVELAASGPGLAVLSDVHFPGWRATVDGRDVPIERVDYLLRGVKLGPGEHRIVMTYAPWSWRIGWIVSLLTAVLLLGAVWKGARR
jgi:hypothetical protein